MLATPDARHPPNPRTENNDVDRRDPRSGEARRCSEGPDRLDPRAHRSEGRLRQRAALPNPARRRPSASTDEGVSSRAKPRRWGDSAAQKTPSLGLARSAGANDGRLLLESAGTSGDLDTQATALLDLLDADYVRHELTDRGRSLADLGDAWETVARKLCGT